MKRSGPIKRRSPMKRHKYNASKTAIAGQVFDSKLEASVYAVLMIRQRTGELRDVKIKPQVRLVEPCRCCGGDSCGGATIVNWTVDFSAVRTDTGATIYIEAKGVEGPDYRRRKRIWKAAPPALLEIWKGSHVRPVLAETIDPEATKRTRPRPHKPRKDAT